MALQTAIMNPQFINFCFPGSVMEYDMDKSLDGGLLAEVETEEDYRETTKDLLSFIDSASSNIKLALDKPVKSKRKVNHRKYLQKQIKRCTGIITPPGNGAETPGKRPALPLAPPPPASFQSKTLPKRDGLHANLQSRSLAALFSPVQDAKKPPLRHRNLPPSFFTEPDNCSKVSPAVAAAAVGMTLKDLERGNPEAVDFFELLGPDYSHVVTEQELYQSVTSRGSAVGGLDPASYDAQHFLFSEPWSHCSGGGAKKQGESVRSGPSQPPPFCHSEPASGPVEDNSLCTLAFTNFFTDCSVPQVTYDVSAGFNRNNYSCL